nr:YqaE/Pmp3 family membrane protein [Allopontixanthobacter sediminis]
MATSTEKIVSILILIASILLPPLGVALKHGISRDFWINLILTIILFVPGVIHAVYVNFLR